MCSGLTTAEAMIHASGAPQYDRYVGESNLQSYIFHYPFEPVDLDLIPCPHPDGEHVEVEIGLEDRLPERYMVSNLYVATHDVSSYEAQGLSLDTVYTLDLYLWRDQESPQSVERKLVVVAAQVMRALKAAELEWELHPQQLDWSIGEAAGSRSETYRLARFSIATTAYVGE